MNDYVPFYFSPITSFTFTISNGNVPVISPTGEDLGQSTEDDRVFLVCRVASFTAQKYTVCFSDFALNSTVPMPTLKTDLDEVETHVHWDVFDESPRTGFIPEIGYGGVCRYFQNMSNPLSRQQRSQKRMAEFLVHNAVPIAEVCCIIVKSNEIRDTAAKAVSDAGLNIPVLVNRGCYFK